MPRPRTTVPKRIDPKNMKEQRLGETKPGSSSGVYCGKCGAFLRPEAISGAGCPRSHKLHEVGMYEFNLWHGLVTEGWWEPPHRLREKLGWSPKRGYITKESV